MIRTIDNFVEPDQGDLGIIEARLIKPGSSGGSVVLARMRRRDSAAMPPLGSVLVDEQAVALVSEWIDSLKACK